MKKAVILTLTMTRYVADSATQDEIDRLAQTTEAMAREYVDARPPSMQSEWEMRVVKHPFKTYR